MTLDRIESALVDAANACDEWIECLEHPSKAAAELETAIDSALRVCQKLRDWAGQEWADR